MKEQCLYCRKSKCVNCSLSQKNLRFVYLNASVMEVETFTFLFNRQCVFPKSQRRGKFLLSLFPSSLSLLSYSSNFYSLLIAYCLGYIYVFGSASSHRRALFGITSGQCLAPLQAHIESLPGNFNSALLRAVVFSIQACVSLVLVSCIRVNFP